MGIWTFAIVNRASEVVFEDRTVNFAKLLRSGRILDADDNAIGMKKVFHGRAFTQKFRVGGDAKAAVSLAVCGERTLQLNSGAGRDGAFFHDEFRGTSFGGNLLRDVVDRGEVGAAVGSRRSANANKYGFTEANGFALIAARRLEPVQPSAVQCELNRYPCTSHRVRPRQDKRQSPDLHSRSQLPINATEVSCSCNHVPLFSESSRVNRHATID